ncbi:MAG: hypothetical protein AMK69_12440 [Nitrospira bacterium SG8_3]|nr:MAG: hypothetical protein AMK69_12440 [Nitrospira bacterium SG8_3]
MINALPFFFGSQGSSTQGTGQATGGVGLDQPRTAGNPSDNPFAKILRDQSAASSLFKNLQLIVPSEDQGRLPDLESLADNQALALQELSGQDIPVDVLRNSYSDIVALSLTDNVQSNPYVVRFMESNGQALQEPEATLPTSLIPLPSLSGNGRSEGGEAKIPAVQLGAWPEAISPEGQLVDVLVSPQDFLTGRPGAEGVQATTTSYPPRLPFPTGYTPLQTPSVETSLADKGVTHMAPNSDRQQLLQDAVKGISLLGGSSDGEPTTESVVTPGKNVGKPLESESRSLQEPATLLPRIPSPPTGTLQGSLRSLVHQIQPSLPFEEASASLAEAVQSSQSRMKYVNGVSPLLSESTGNGKEPSMAIPSDLLGESGLSSTGDRSRDGLEATGKAEGVDSNAGQGLNNGMGNPTHSQTGFQQSSSSSSPGSTARMAEERVPDLPGPALQRLQMEVQLSETNRVQIDVGVQHRQVYASLLMDQATLKNLAVQFVPQLEEQLTQGEMELQEFSAEVRDHQSGQESDTRSDGAGTQTSQRGITALHQTPGSLSHMAGRAEEQGFHLVA